MAGAGHRHPSLSSFENLGRGGPRHGAGLAALVACSIAFTLAAGPARGHITDTENPASVLILHSYYQTFTWTDQITRGIHDVLGREGDAIEIYLEHMDAKRHPEPQHLALLAQLYKEKYPPGSIDLIICSDDHALSFLLEEGAEVLPGVPAVFCGINGFNEDLRRRGRPITGVQEALDYTGTLDVAMLLHPRARDIVVITDVSKTGRALWSAARRAYSRYENRYSFTWLDGIPWDELSAKLSLLGPESIVVLFTYNRDSNGRNISHEASAEAIASHTDAPVYSFWRFYLGHGILGGSLVGGEEQGRLAADLALRILDGERAEEIPVVSELPRRHTFDYAALKEAGIDPASLPRGSEIVGQPAGPIQRYKKPLLYVSLAMAFLLALTVALAVNVIKRRRFEAALKESERVHRGVFEGMAQGVIIYDGAGRALFSNPAAAELFGMETGQGGARRDGSAPSLILGEDGAELEGELLPQACALRSKAEVREQVLRCRRAGDDADRWILASAVPTFLPGESNPYRIFATYTDITQLKQAEEALRDTENRFRTMLELTPDSISITRLRDGVFVFANPGFTALTGYSPEEIMNRSALDLALWVEPEEREPLFDLIRKEIPVRNFEMGIQGKDGKVRDALLSATQIRFSGEPHMLAITRDVTELKSAERELHRTMEDLQRSNSELEQFAYVASHDLQEPLRMVNSYVQLLAKRYWNQLDGDADEFVQFVLDGVERMRLLIRDLLTFSRAGKGTESRGQVDCNAVLRVVQRNLWLAIENTSAEIAAGQLPVVRGEFSRLSQVLQNLILNGITFQPKGNKPRVEISAARQGADWVFRVEDNGLGIAQEYRERAFQLFQRLHTRDEFPGSGIGLAICRRIVEGCGGRIWVEEGSLGGAAVVFTIPMTPVEVTALPDSLDPGESGSARKSA